MKAYFFVFYFVFALLFPSITAVDCSTATTCGACAKLESSCVWCDLKEIENKTACIDGSILGPSDAECRNWYWGQCDISGKAFGTDSTYVILIVLIVGLPVCCCCILFCVIIWYCCVDKGSKEGMKRKRRQIRRRMSPRRLRTKKKKREKKEKKKLEESSDSSEENSGFYIPTKEKVSEEKEKKDEKEKEKEKEKEETTKQEEETQKEEGIELEEVKVEPSEEDETIESMDDYSYFKEKRKSMQKKQEYGIMPVVSSLNEQELSSDYGVMPRTKEDLIDEKENTLEYGKFPSTDEEEDLHPDYGFMPSTGEDYEEKDMNDIELNMDQSPSYQKDGALSFSEFDADIVQERKGSQEALMELDDMADP